jgi:hypothetical protein
MLLPRDLLEMLSAFGEQDVRYLVVGGHAVGVHARPRSTKDLDVWLDSSQKNVSRACQALRGFGVPDTIVSALQSATPDEIVWLGRIPARVDLLLSLPGVEFGTAWQHRVVIEVEGTRLFVIGRDDLVTNKRAVGRPQDLRDVRAMLRASKKGTPVRLTGHRPKRPRG